MGKNFSGIADEVHEQIEFFRRQSQPFALLTRGVCFQIDHEVSRLQNLRLGFGSRFAAQGGANACQQLVHAKRLGDIVVGAGIECVNFGFFFASH